MAAGRGFPAPPARTHRIHIGEDRVEVRWSLARELRTRLLLVLGGGLVAAMFGWPWFVVPEDLFAIKLLFAAVAVLLGGVLVGAGLFAPPRRFHVRVDPGQVEVIRARGIPAGTYPTDRILAVVSTGSAADSSSGGARQTRVGVYLEGEGVLGILRTDDPGQVESLERALHAIAAAATGRQVPTWPLAPLEPAASGIEVSTDGAPEGWPEHGQVGVDPTAEGCTIHLPAAAPGRRVLAYVAGAGPLILVTAGFAILAMVGPGGSWNPLAILASPDAFALAIVGAWLGIGLYPSKRLVSWVHHHVGSGPYRVVVDRDRITVLAAGHQVVDQVPIEQVLGFERTRWGLAIVTEDGRVGLPSYGLSGTQAKAWLMQGLAYASDRWGERTTPAVALARSASEAGSGKRPSTCRSGRPRVGDR